MKDEILIDLGVVSEETLGAQGFFLEEPTVCGTDEEDIGPCS